MRTMSDFLEHYARQRKWTRKIAAAVPEEHFDWSPADDAFSCGDLIRHLMQAEIFWTRLLVKAVSGETLDPFHLEGSAEQRMQRFRRANLNASHDGKYGETVAECLERWSEIQRRTEAELTKIPDEALYDLEIEHPLTKLEAPLWQMLLIMVAHEGHHRGQLTAYLKVLGVEQPAAVIAT